MAYTKYSLTPANNNATPPDGAPEGMLPSAVNDTMRDMMAQIRDVGDGIRDGTYTMTAAKITGGSITGVALSGNTFTNPIITGGSINNTPIGATTASTGAFTSLSSVGAGVIARQAATQDGIEIRGRAGGTGNWEVILTPATLSADRTITIPDASTTIVGTDTTQTLTNKTITTRVSSTASITSPLAWNSDNFDQYAATAQSGALTINADAGTPVDGRKIVFRFKDNGTARALTWTTGSSKSFRAIGIVLPTTTITSKIVYVGCVYNASDDRWDAIAVAQEAT